MKNNKYYLEINVYCPHKKHEGYMNFQETNIWEDRKGAYTLLPRV
jgi:dihydroorotate dehydrogenase